MKTAVYENYKPTRYEGKGFLRNLNLRIHRDITGEMWFGVWSRLFWPLQSNCSQNVVNSTVISRNPQESAGKELSCKSMLNNVIAT